MAHLAFLAKISLGLILISFLVGLAACSTCPSKHQDEEAGPMMIGSFDGTTNLAVKNLTVDQTVQDGQVYFSNTTVSVVSRSQTFQFHVPRVSLRPKALPVTIYFVWTSCLPEELCLSSPNYNMTFAITQVSGGTVFLRTVNGVSVNKWTFNAVVDTTYRLTVTYPNIESANVSFYLNMNWPVGPPAFAVILLIVAGIIGAILISQISIHFHKLRQQASQRSGYVTID